MKMRLVISASLALVVFSLNALSHDYWIEPEVFFAPLNQPVNVRLYLGEGLKSESERPLQKERTVRFQLISGKETEDLLAAGKQDQTPIAQVMLKRPGNYLIAMERNASTIKLDAKKFKEYLTEEGLDSIIALREKAGESNMEGRERYTRYLKSLLQAGAVQDDAYQRKVGHQLEIIPQSNPYGLKLGDTLKVRIEFEGKPLAGAYVFANNRNAQAISGQRALTSVDGTASFTLDQPGQWLVRLVHMRRCAGSCQDIDWESFWAAYTFGMK